MSRVILIILLAVSVVSAQVMTFFQKRIPTSTSTLMNGLLEHWDLDEESGTRYGYFGHDLTDNNTVLYGTGKYSNASDHELDNGNEYFSHADDDSLSFGAESNFMISCWVKLESNSFSPLVSKTDGVSVENWEYDLRRQGTTNVFRFTTGNGSNRSLVESDTVATTARWFHAVCWYNTSTDSIYIRINNGGVKMAEAVYEPHDGADSFFIGYWNNAGYELDGLIDLVTIWNRCPQASNGYAMSDSAWNKGNGWRPGL